MRFFLKVIVLFLLTSNVIASVTLNNTRIIYPSGSNGVNVIFKNENKVDYIVQSWLDAGDENSTPETADADFILVPATFKIKKNTNQTLRLIYSGKPLPSNRESIFYFNFIQFPTGISNTNQMLVVLKTRVKVFYRPSGLNGSLYSSADGLVIEERDGFLFVDNQSPYYLNIPKILIENKAKESQKESRLTIPPFSHFKLNAKVKNPEKAEVRFVNDQGGFFTRSFEIKKNSEK